MNPLYATTKLGTIGELLVQLRLLEHDIQAAPPVKDSGNDLIAIRGRSFRAIQVRCTTGETIDKPDNRVLYDILAIVQMAEARPPYSFDHAKIYLFAQREVVNLSRKLSQYKDHLLSCDLIKRLFDESALSRQ